MTWTFPNVLTVFRLLAAPAFAWAFVLLPRPLADWVALALFVGAATTDWVDGHLARRWRQESRFGAMLDPIADKAMVLIALAILLGLSGLDPWIVLPGSLILFREIFVSGLREYLGSDAGKLSVTRVAKWKTTAQMAAISILLLGLGLQEVQFWMAHSMTEEAYRAQMSGGLGDPNTTWLVVTCRWIAGVVGTAMIWVAAILTVISGADYLRKALPFLAQP